MTKTNRLKNPYIEIQIESRENTYSTSKKKEVESDAQEE